MKTDELRELMDLLEAAGVRAELCDTPVRVSALSAVCGVPREIGDDEWDDYILLPKALVGRHPVMMVPAEGDSMAGAGIAPGDSLRVCFGMTVNDGDIVLAWLDGRCTVKTFFTDDEGRRWLVPQNDNYDAIMLTEEMNARMLGVVQGVEKASPRVQTRSLSQSVRRTQGRQRAAKKLSDGEVNALIVRIGTEVAHARQWFAVYKAMAEYGVTDEGDYQGFCARVRGTVPAHGHLPDAREVARMEVQSFSKPVAMWAETNAPVSGTRFRDYLRIALTMKDYLSGKR